MGVTSKKIEKDRNFRYSREKLQETIDFPIEYEAFL